MLDKNNYEEKAHEQIEFLNSLEHAEPVRYPITDSSDQRTHLALSWLRAKTWGALVEKFGGGVQADLVSQEVKMTYTIRKNGKTQLVDVIADVECEKLSMTPDYDIVNMRIQTVKELGDKLDKVSTALNNYNKPFWKRWLRTD